MFTAPTVVGDVVFVGSCSGVAYAFDRERGTIRWSYDTRQDGGPAQFHGAPAVVGDLLVTGSDTAEPNLLYAFEWESGELRWKTDRDVIETDVLLAAGNLVGATWNGSLVALDPASGARRWKAAVEDSRCGRRPHPPALAGDRIFFADGEGALSAIDAATGRVLWRRDLGCASTAPVVWGEDLLVGLAPGRIVRIRLDDGALVGEREVGGRAHSRLTLAGERLVALVGERDLVAFDRDLRELWRRRARSEWSSYRPLVWRGVVVVGDGDGNLFGLDPAEGEIAWTLHVPGVIRGLGADGDLLFVGTLRGSILAVAPDGLEKPVAEPPAHHPGSGSDRGGGGRER